MKHKYSKIKWVHRYLHFVPPQADCQKGADVKALQHAINRVARTRKMARRLEVNGECGRATIALGRHVAWSLGIGLPEDKHGLPQYTQRLIRHPNLRTPKQKKRAQAWKEAHPPHTKAVVKGNKVTGGTTRERIVAGCEEAAQLYASGKSHRFYSQPGGWTVEHGITGEPSGYRSDCSQFVTSMYWSSGIKEDPNGQDYKAGYTGTLAAHGVYISRAELRPGDFVLYGPAPHHHVEVYVGPGNRTIGHGSPPVDPGDIYMMADPHFVRSPGLK